MARKDSDFDGLTIVEGDVPTDETPTQSQDASTSGASADGDNWFNPDFPYSSEEHPYGYFPDGQGGWDFDKPRKNKPRGYGGKGSGVSKGHPASEKSARTAAKLLAQMNLFIGMGISAFGLRMTAQEIVAANDQFEEMAYNALLSDPKLCAKILSAGMSSGRSQLMFAYLALAGALTPVAMEDIRVIRAERSVA